MTFTTFAQIFSDLNPKDRSTAIVEILILMAGAFLLGYLFRYLICKYAHHEEATTPSTARVVSTRSTDTPRTKTASSDDLTVIEGVGPQINRILQAAGIKTFDDLASTSTSKVRSILRKQGPRYRVHDPSTWGEQAALARDKKWDELETLKDKLTSGRK